MRVREAFQRHTTVRTADPTWLLADLVGDLPWACDLDAGMLSFGDRCGWDAEVLGTESEESGKWLWAWANEGSRIPAERQAAALQLKAWGEEHGVAELTPTLRLKNPQSVSSTN